MPSSLSRSGRRLVLLAAAALSLTVATSTDTTNHFTWLDCPLPALAPSPSPPPPLPSTINSTFPSNVLALLHALPSAAAPTGFASLSRGEGTSRGFVRGLCRGDSAPDVCSRCLQSATLHIDGHCSSNRHRRAGIWYDKCFLSYADTDTSTTYEEGFRQALYNHRNISDKDVFDRNNTYLNLVIKISDLAANGGSSELASAVPMFATGEAVYDDRGAPNGTKYGMVQCMRDRTASECALCLWNSMEQLETRNGGGEMLGYNCYLRVEFYAFYNLSLSAVPASPPLAPAPSSFMSTVGERNRNGGSVGVIAGVGGGFAALLLGVVLYIIFYRRRKAKKAAVLPFSEDSILHATTPSVDKIALSSSQADSPSAVPGITVDKSVEFSYEELFNATEGFSISNEIGKGGFGVVYYAEIRGEKAAIKKMDVQATHEFLAELNVLTHVYHLNLVRLIGYCIERSLFIVYEYIENGNLRQHLCGTGYEPLSWAARVQIALDSARGLQYIHEHTVPVYIHRDIKSANILIDKNNRAKVADFGLTKLAEVGNASLPTRGIVGTFGYMPPEYAQYGDVSRKVDVFAFGVVLYELISAKEAIVRSTEPGSDSMGLVYLFKEALSAQDPKEGLRRLIDPALGLGEHYPMDSILKMTVLARACTQEDPESRPTMRSVVVALMTLSFMDEGVMEREL